MQITSGKYKSRKLITPKTTVRPTLSKIRSAVFDVLYSYFDFENKIFLDMFAGSGIIGLEAASRGFFEIFAIEKDKENYDIIKKNYDLLGIHSNVFLGDSLKKISCLNMQFDIIFIDPPYQANLYNPALEIIHFQNILNQNGMIILEHPKDIKIDFSNYKIFKQKFYGDKVITFLTH